MDSEALEVHSKVIIHIDIDCFYAQVEMIENPSLYDKPLGIRQQNIIVTCNYPARERGVSKLMRVVDAQRKCPDLVMVLGEDLTKYRKMTNNIHSLLKNYTNLVEKLGCDENYLDVTEFVNNRLSETNINELKSIGYVFRVGDEDENEETCSCGCKERLLLGSVVAQEIREALKSELQITCCGGIAHNKLLAKLISGLNKPNKQTTIFPDSVMAFMDTLKSPRDIPGIGSEMEKKLSSVNINTMQDLQNCKLSDLDFIKNPLIFKKLSFGIDYSPVVASEKPKQHGVEHTFSKCDSLTECQAKLDTMILKLCRRIIDDGRIPEALTVIIRKKSLLTKDQKRDSLRGKITPSIVRNLNEENINEVKDKLMGLAMPLFQKLAGKKFELNLLGVTMSKLKEKDSNWATITKFFAKDTQPLRISSVSETSVSPTNRSILNYFQKQSQSSGGKRPAENESGELKRSKVDQKSPKMGGIDLFYGLPEYVDKETFNELPREVQAELLREWKNQKLSQQGTSQK